MRVDLTVSNKRFAGRAENAWRACREAIRPLTFQELDPDANVRVERDLGMAARGLATAEWVPPAVILPEYANFCLSDAFFGGDRDMQVVTLLHESVHIRLSRGRLVNNYRVIRGLNRLQTLATLFELDRWNLSWEVLTFAQEVGVDKFIAAADCPAAICDRYFRERAHFYRNGEGCPYADTSSPSLAIYHLFYRLLRVELGLLVIQDAGVREHLEELRQQYDTQLREQAGEELAWFGAIQQKYQNVTVDTDAPNPDAYRELFDRICNLPAPNQG